MAQADPKSDAAAKALVEKQRQANLARVPIVDGKLAPNDLNGLFRVADMMWQAGLAPKSYLNPQALVVGMQLGQSLGLDILRGPQTIAVINNIPSIYGDGALGVVIASGQLEWIKEERIYGTGERAEGGPAEEVIGFRCTVKRRGTTFPDPVWHKFDETDAKRAGLDKKETYRSHGPRMYQRRARARAFSDVFADILMGLPFVIDVIDTEGHVVGEAKVEPEAPTSKAEQLKQQLNVTTVAPSDRGRPITADQGQRLAAAQDAFPMSSDEWKMFLASHECTPGDMLTEDQAERLIQQLDDLAEEERTAQGNPPPEATPDPPAQDPDAPLDTEAPINEGQLAALETARANAQVIGATWEGMLRLCGVRHISELKQFHMVTVLNFLEIEAKNAPDQLAADPRARPIGSPPDAGPAPPQASSGVFPPEPEAEPSPHSVDVKPTPWPPLDETYREVRLASGVKFGADTTHRVIQWLEPNGNSRWRKPTAEEESEGLALLRANEGDPANPAPTPADPPVDPPAATPSAERHIVKFDCIKLRSQVGEQVFTQVCQRHGINLATWERIRAPKMRVLRHALREAVQDAERQATEPEPAAPQAPDAPPGPATDRDAALLEINGYANAAKGDAWDAYTKACTDIGLEYLTIEDGTDEQIERLLSQVRDWKNDA